jgi:hypothetical protein
MEVFGFAGLFGLILGFMFGVGCAFAVLYTIYMGGYRKAISDSLQESPTKRFKEELDKIQRRGRREAAPK